MIQFYGRMYNYTDGEFIDSSPTLYSLAQYVGSSISIGYDGTTRTDIPFNEFIIEASTNIGMHFEFYAKEYFEANNQWPVLRLCTSNDPEDYYLEWMHDNPTGFNIKAPGIYVRWASCFQWIDTYTAPYFNSLRSYIFTSAGTIEDLAQNAISWSGAVRNNDSIGAAETLISFATFQVSAPSNCLISNAGTWLGSAGGRDYYKIYDGPMIAFFYNNNFNGMHGPITFCPANNNSGDLPPYNGDYTGSTYVYSYETYKIDETTSIRFTARYGYHTAGVFDPDGLIQTDNTVWGPGVLLNDLFDANGVQITYIRTALYDYLQGEFVNPGPPPSDVDPTDIPPEDDPPTPVPPDNQDPYYDPTSDPKDPTYDPTKDPKDPEYDPTEPHTPFRPPSTTDGGGPAPIQPVPGVVTIPEAPPAFVTNNSLFTLYNPSGGDLNNLADFLWSPTWSIDTLKKIFVNPMDCILGLMVMPQLPADVATKQMNFGNVPTGITMHYFTKQFCDFDCGTFKLEEFYMSYLDYTPYTKVSIFLPYIGEVELSTDEVMNTTIGVKYRFDISCGACVAFVSVDGNVLYSFSGNCAAHIPLSANDWGSTVTALAAVPLGAAKVGAIIGGGPVGALGAAAAISVMSMKEKVTHSGTLKGSAGLMGIQTPYLIVNRPRQAAPLNQNSFTGYPSFITESLGSLHGYTEVEQCHLDHVPATHEELAEIERLLKEGVML